MTNRQKCLIAGSLLLVSLDLVAQTHQIFYGGDGDGFTGETYKKVLNNGIFAGSDEDGHNATSIRSELNNLSFVGGPGDGFSLAGIIQPFIMASSPAVAAMVSTRTSSPN